MTETDSPDPTTAEIEDERFLVQLQLVLKLLTFEWEANLELLAVKLHELCGKYLQHLETTKPKTTNVTVMNEDPPVIAPIITKRQPTAKAAKRFVAFLVAPDVPDSEPEAARVDTKELSNGDHGANTAPEAEANDQTKEVEPPITQLYDENLDPDTCHLIVSHPTFKDSLPPALVNKQTGELTGGPTGETAGENAGEAVGEPSGKLDQEPSGELNGEPDDHVLGSEDYKSWVNSSLIKVLSTHKPPNGKQPAATPEVKNNYENYYFVNREVTDMLSDTKTTILYIRFENLTILPSLTDEVQHIIRNALYPSHKSITGVPAYIGTEIVPAPNTDFQDVWDREVLAEWYRGAALLWSLEVFEPFTDPKGEADSSGLGGLIGALPLGSATSLAQSALAITDVVTDIIEPEDGDGSKKKAVVEATVEAKGDSDSKVEAKIEATVEMKITEIPDTADASESGPSIIESAIESAVEAGKAQLEAKLVESTAAAIGKSEAALLESTLALGKTEASLVESAVALGKSEAALVESTLADVVDTKASLLESAVDLANSKDSLLQSAAALGKSKSGWLGTAIKVGDMVGESMGVDLIDTSDMGDEKETVLTGWEKLKSEFPCPSDYPADKDYKEKFTSSIEDCIPSLKSTETALSKVDPAGGSALNAGLDGVEKALGFLGPNPAAMVAAGVLKAGREMAEKKKKDAAAAFQGKSTNILRKLWFLTTEVYAFIWFAKPTSDGKYTFPSAFHKSSFKLIREKRVGIYTDEDMPLDLPEDYFIYLHEQTVLLQSYTEELETHAKEMVEGLDSVI
ncbi:hypothetical protein ABW20_dc0103454 [Dactylellina cionopaga]|nr:hypothetical protein ABW20_dc0103454 [Dactylellina cionopaga]